MKKHVKIVAILFLAVLAFEGLMIAYNQVIYKLYESKHLIHNEPYAIALQDIHFESNGGTTVAHVDRKIDGVYNLCLNLKEKNEDAYVTVFCNEKQYTLKRDNVEATKFKVYFGEEISLENFEISFYDEQIQKDNIKDIGINENIHYMPQKGIVFSRVATIFLLALIGYIFFLIVQKVSKKTYKVDKAKFFIVAAFILGIGIGTLVIPLTKYDEHTHFWRAYEISRGNFISSWENILPKSVIELVVYNNEYHIHDKKYSDLQENLQKELNPIDAEGFYVGGAGAYSPFNYIPQLVGILIGRALHLNPMIIAYLGRMTNFLSFIILIYFSIKLLPKEKWKDIILVVALLPMTLNLATSLSPDAIAISVSIFLISYILSLKYKKEKIKIWQVCLLAFLCVMTSLVKIAYLPLILLFLLIPKEKFTSKKIYYIILIGIMLLTILINLFWMRMSSEGATVAIRTNSEEQIYFVLANPLEFMMNMLFTMCENIYEYVTTMVGGWNTTALGTTLLLMVLLITTFSKNEKVDGNKTILLSKKDKIIMTISLMGVMLLIFAGLYVQWTVATYNRVEGIQGRYFLPILAIFLILLEKDKLTIKTKNSWIKYLILLVIVYIPMYINIIREYL